MLNEQFSKLYDFIDKAVRSRKYFPDSAQGYKVALRMFEQELNDEEKDSIQIFKDRIDTIKRVVFDKNSSKITANSLETYKHRVERVIRDFEMYGNDPTKLANWNPEKRNRSSKSVKEKVEKNQKANELSAEGYSPEVSGDSKLVRNEIPLKPGIKAVIFTPEILDSDDIRKILAFLNYISELAGTGKTFSEKGPH